MRPVLLEMNGFASFREPTEVDFRGADYFALVGPTGSGKSTVVDAITFALYGSAPRWGNRRAVSNALAPTTDRGVVRLVFDVTGHRYIAARELRRVGDGVTVKNARLERLIDPDALGAHDDATWVLAADSEVTPAVERLLGMPFEHFATCAVLPQGAFAEFLHAQPARRQDILVKLMGLETYPHIAQAANARAEAEGRRTDLLARQLEGFADATDHARRAARHRVAALEKTAERVRAALPDLAAREAAVTQARNACETLAAERDLLEAVVVPTGLEEFTERERAVAAVVRAAAAELAAAEAADTAARERLAAAPSRSFLEQTCRAHAELDMLRQRLEAAKELHRRQAAALAAVTAARRRAVSLALRARREQQDAARLHLAAALRPWLRSGQACPVCEQRVETMPGPLPAPDLDAAEQARLRADREVERLDDEWMRASRSEQSTADELTALTERITAVRAALVDAPAAKQATAELDRRERLERAAAAADAGVRRARAAKVDAEQAAAGIREEAQAAWVALERARDPLVALGAPALDRTDLTAARTALTSWAGETAAARRRALHDAHARLARARDRLAAAEERLRAVLTAHRMGFDAERPLAVTAEPAVWAALERARQEERRLAERRRQAAELDAQRREAEHGRQVAKTLGRLLRADEFPRWLVTTALDALVADASTTLAELSGGQFELTHDNGNFLVIDHADADSRRPVKTLSGGETFQASLALALALAAQSPAMAAAGAAHLESIFLDEGFGALDEATLETVAATLEELAVGREQMVGVVTHVSGLAERVPTRFVVRRDRWTSSVRREEV